MSGALQAIDIPTPQPFGLKKIPGDDPAHQFQKPGPTDVRGMCPTLNALGKSENTRTEGEMKLTDLCSTANHGYIRYVCFVIIILRDHFV